jgi:hypothetical protein
MVVREHKTLTGSCGAIFSDCEQYRYRLWREWDTRLPTICFLMLNPSTADEQVNDPTIARCESRAVAMGCGRLDVVNLFPWRSTDPDQLLIWIDPLGPARKADGAIMDAIERSSTVVCAWGSHRAATERAADVLRMIRITGYHGRLFHLGLNQDGSPKHPLYIAKSIKPKRFEL